MKPVKTLGSKGIGRSVRIGSKILRFGNPNWYQDNSVVREVWIALKGRISDENIQDIKFGLKLRVLAKFGTRLLIRVAKQLLNDGKGKSLYNVKQEVVAVFTFVNDVLKFRARKTRHMRAFIEQEFNPDTKKMVAVEYNFAE